MLDRKEKDHGSVGISGPGLPYLAALLGVDEQTASALIGKSISKRKQREAEAIELCPPE